MFPGHQVVVGARSGVGKTRFALASTAAVCGCGQMVQMNLLEPTRDEFMRGLACFVAGLRASVASEPWTASRDDRDKFRAAMDVVRKWPLTLYDNANMSLDEVLARGRYAIHRGCRMIGVDYLQRLYVQQAEKGESIRLKVARASMALANLVKDTNCTSLVLSQLKRTDGMGIPTMQDLRESGQIENDAHLIVLLHREYDAEKGIFGNQGAYVVPKRRFGAPCNRRAYFDPSTATWEDGSLITTHWSDK
jgi:replicative DNA helicase